MRLTDLEKTVVGALCFRSDVSVPALAKELKQREHKVRYAVDRLIEQRVLVPHVYINPNVIGFSEYQLFVSLAKHGAAARERFIAAVRACAQVSCFGAVGGPFEFDIMLAARNVQEVSSFVDTLSNTLKKIEYHRVVALQIRMTYFAPKYLGLSRFPVPSLEYGPSAVTHRLDELDWKILGSLVGAQGQPYSRLARSLGVPLTTFMYRLKTYREHGILKAEGYFINPYNLGLHPYLFLVEFTSTSQTVRQSLESFCFKHANVTYLIENLGAWDYQIGARFEDARHVAVFLDELHQRFEGTLGAVTSVPVFEPLKAQWNPKTAAAAVD